jgi:hypothetical protein
MMNTKESSKDMVFIGIIGKTIFIMYMEKKKAASVYGGIMARVESQLCFQEREKKYGLIGLKICDNPYDSVIKK